MLMFFIAPSPFLKSSEIFVWLFPFSVVDFSSIHYEQGYRGIKVECFMLIAGSALKITIIQIQRGQSRHRLPCKLMWT